MKLFQLCLIALLFSFASSAQIASVTGPSSICVGTAVTYTDATTGGSWTISDALIATIGSSSGVAVGLIPGVDTVIYTVGSSRVVYAVTVNAIPGGISGPSSVCPAATITLTDATTGGFWTGSTPSVATVGSLTGIVAGVTVGVDTITYTIGTGCATSEIVTINPAPTGILGSTAICRGSSATLTDGVFGGLWSSSSPLVATVGSTTGVVSGVAAGTVVITYSLGTGCMTARTVTVNPTPGAITGTFSVCVGATNTLTDFSIGGTWISSAPTIATVGSGGGVTGVSPGTTTITYALGTGCTATAAVTVNAAPTAYLVTGGGTYCSGGAGVHVGVAVSQSGVGYQLFLGGVPVGLPIYGTGSALSFGFMTTAGTYTIAGTYTTGCSTNMTGSAVVSIAPLPTSYNVTGGGSYCAGGTGVPVGLNNSSVGIDYQLYISGLPRGAVIAGTGTALSFGNQTVAGSYIVIATNTATGCNNPMTGSATVAIDTLPSGYTVAGGGTYCSGGSGVCITLSSSTTGVTYELLSGTTVIDTLAGTGSSLSYCGITVGGSYSIEALYAHTTGCSLGMTGIVSVAVNPLPNVYTVGGGGAYCSGGTGTCVTLSSSDVGISYQLMVGGIATGTPLSGTGSSLSFCSLTTAGTYTIVATNVTTTCSQNMAGSATVSISALPTVYTITGGGAYCSGGAGVAVGLSGSQTGVSYQLFNGTFAVGSPVTGTGSAISFGLETTAGTYTVNATNITTSCINSMSGAVTVSVNPLPTVYAVTGGGSYCAGGTGVAIGVSNSDAGISYELILGGATVATTAGTGGAISFGSETTAGIYTAVAVNATTSCTSNMTGSATVVITPTVTPTVSITAAPGTSVCNGTTDTFTAVSTGGGTSPTYQWYVNGASLSIGGSYVYTPTNGDNVSVVMISSAACATPTTATYSVTMTVYSPSVSATATSPACNGAVTMTGSGASTYSWAPSTGLSCTPCGSPNVTPTGTVTYTITGTDSHGCTATDTLTVDGNNISGKIVYTGGTSADTFKVWLIRFNPSDSSITALDSTTACMEAGVPYFEFMDPAAGNYMVKARLNTSVAGTSGWVPTYSLSSPYWYAATTDAHTSSADAMNINMVYGTVPAGPGFIAGYVVSGAGRGTSGDIPDQGMLIYLEDGSGNVLTYTYTDPSGLFTFPDLKYGSYIIYPEDYKYNTTPSAVITLSATNDSVGSIDFKEHTTYGTITPNATSVPVVVNNAMQCYYPNPTSGLLNISLGAHAAGVADVVITNVTGSVVYNTAVNLATNQSQAQLDLSALNEGMYFISFRSEDISFTGKLVIAK